MTVHFHNLLDELLRRSLRMASAVENMLIEACTAVSRVDHNLARIIIERDEDIDAEEVAIESEALRLMTLFQPMGADMRRLCAVLKVNGDLERIADCAVNMAERVQHMDPAAELTPSVLEFDQIKPVVQRMLRDVVQAYANIDAKLAEKVRSEDEIVDSFYGQCIRKIIVEAGHSPQSMPRHLDVLSIAKNLERVADHCSNIAEDVIYLATGQIVRHSSLNSGI